LDPFTVNDELWDSALSNLPDQLFRSTRRGGNVDLFMAMLSRKRLASRQSGHQRAE
jgi:hypothetical protein